MQELYKLKDLLCEELKKYASKGISGASLEAIDKIAHACKNVCKIIEKEEETQMSYDGGSYRGSYDGGSYMGGYSSRGRGRYAARDSMGRYSSAENEMAQKIRDLMQEAPNDHVRQSMQNILNELEQR